MVQKLTLDEIGVDPEDAADVIYGLRRELQAEKDKFLYATSTNIHPTRSDTVKLVYLGMSVKEAEAAVGDYTDYQIEDKDFPVNYLHMYSGIPNNYVEWELIQYYMTDGLWFSIVRFPVGALDNGD